MKINKIRDRLKEDPILSSTIRLGLTVGKVVLSLLIRVGLWRIIKNHIVEEFKPKQNPGNFRYKRIFDLIGPGADLRYMPSEIFFYAEDYYNSYKAGNDSSLDELIACLFCSHGDFNELFIEVNAETLRQAPKSVRLDVVDDYSLFRDQLFKEYPLFLNYLLEVKRGFGLCGMKEVFWESYEGINPPLWKLAYACNELAKEYFKENDSRPIVTPKMMLPEIGLLKEIKILESGSGIMFKDGTLLDPQDN